MGPPLDAVDGAAAVDEYAASLRRDHRRSLPLYLRLLQQEDALVAPRPATDAALGGAGSASGDGSSASTNGFHDALVEEARLPLRPSANVHCASDAPAGVDAAVMRRGLRAYCASARPYEAFVEPLHWLAGTVVAPADAGAREAKADAPALASHVLRARALQLRPWSVVAATAPAGPTPVASCMRALRRAVRAYL